MTHKPWCRFGQVPTLEESPRWAGIIRECICHENGLIPFEPIERWIKWIDINRCPYMWGTSEEHNWSFEDNKRLLLIALDRYADYLKGQIK